jgi:hypothetical protein
LNLIIYDFHRVSLAFCSRVLCGNVADKKITKDDNVGKRKKKWKIYYDGSY